MTTLSSRLEKLERQANAKAQSGTEMMLRALRASGFDDVCAMFAEDDVSNGRKPTPFWRLMDVMSDSRNEFEFERYRGLVPDEVIRHAYSCRRNYAYGDEAIVTRVRQLAGVVDGDGNVMPGYVLLDNGCIVDAP